MAISNYSELQVAVSNYLHRSDLTDLIPDFISLAEAKLNRVLRLRFMENTTTGDAINPAALPTGFVEMISIAAVSNSKTYPLTYISPENLYGDSATPCFYTIIGDSIYFEPSGTGTYSMNYYKKFDALSSGVNWLITNAPDVYLYATLLEAEPYLKDDKRIPVWASLLKEGISMLQASDKSDRYGSGLVVRAA